MQNKDHECGPWTGLADFQAHNCRDCKYAKVRLIGTGNPCCTKIGLLDHKEGVCHSSRSKEGL